MSFTIYHNPRCSKSRQTLALLRENNVEPEVVLYLENPPTFDELTHIATLLNVPAITFTRTKEQAFKEAGLTKESSDEDILRAVAEYPILLERPIVIQDNKKAVIGRPPENVLALL